MIDRSLYTPRGDDPNFPVPVSDSCTVPTAQMAYLLADLLATNGDVLELGTGSGYQTAILAERCRSVVTVESDDIPFRQVFPENVGIFRGDAYTFVTSNEFDAILVTFGTSHLSPNWIAQLKQGGRLVVPLKIGSSCRISAYERRGDLLLLVDAVAWAPFTDAVEA